MVVRSVSTRRKKQDEPKLVSKLDIDVRVRFAKDATGIEVTTTDQDGRKETSAEIIPREPADKKPS